MCFNIKIITKAGAFGREKDLFVSLNHHPRKTLN